MLDRWLAERDQRRLAGRKRTWAVAKVIFSGHCSRWLLSNLAMPVPNEYARHDRDRTAWRTVKMTNSFGLDRTESPPNGSKLTGFEPHAKW
jgi:hypothetical protein